MINLYKKFKSIEEIKAFSTVIFDVICKYKNLDELTNNFTFVQVEEYQTYRENIRILGECNLREKKLYIAMLGHMNPSQLIDTFAHEIAHIPFIKHCKKHTQLKNLIKKLIKMYINYELENVA